MPGRDDSGLGIRAVDLGPGVRAGFTSAVTGDLRAPVGRERARAWAGVPLVLASQVHGTRLVWAGAPGDRPDCALCETNCEAAISDRNVGEADAIGLSGPGAAAVIQVADCVPVLLADPVARLACAVHAGRRGFLAGVVPLAVRALEARGAVPTRVRAAIGPCVCGRCYEVPAEMAAAADRFQPGCAARTSWGTPSIDLPAGVAAQLAAAGVRHVDVDGRCTLEDRGLFSYRRDGRAAGRQAGVIELLAV